MDDRVERRGRLPRGWFATLSGGVLGGLGFGFLAFMISLQAVETYYPADDWGGLPVLFFGTLGGLVAGSVLGCGWMLNAFHHDRPFITGFAFAGIEFVLLMALWMIVRLIMSGPVDFNPALGSLYALSPIGAAILARMSTSDEGARATEG